MASSVTTRIAHYVYAAADGAMCSTMKSIVASSYERAIEEASEKAPAGEFDVSVHAESEDYFLGSKRHLLSCWHNDKIMRSAYDKIGQPLINVEREAIDLLLEVAEAPELRCDFELEVGDI